MKEMIWQGEEQFNADTKRLMRHGEEFSVTVDVAKKLERSKLAKVKQRKLSAINKEETS